MHPKDTTFKMMQSTRKTQLSRWCKTMLECPILLFLFMLECPILLFFWTAKTLALFLNGKKRCKNSCSFVLFLSCSFLLFFERQKNFTILFFFWAALFLSDKNSCYFWDFLKCYILYVRPSFHRELQKILALDIVLYGFTSFGWPCWITDPRVWKNYVIPFAVGPMFFSCARRIAPDLCTYYEDV